MNIIKAIINVIKSIFVKPKPDPAKKYSESSYGSGKYNK